MVIYGGMQMNNEDIKILEELMEDSKDYGQFCVSRIELNAIENLIKRI